MMTCVVCGVDLAGKLDTFGPVDLPMCQQDYLDLEWERIHNEQYPPMFTCTHYPDGSIGCAMNPEWIALEDALEAAMQAEAAADALAGGER